VNFFLPISARKIEEGAKAAVPDVISTPSLQPAPNQGSEAVARKDRKPS
jgi:hypothetical protein